MLYNSLKNHIGGLLWRKMIQVSFTQLKVKHLIQNCKEDNKSYEIYGEVNQPWLKNES